MKIFVVLSLISLALSALAVDQMPQATRDAIFTLLQTVCPGFMILFLVGLAITWRKA